MGIAGALLAGGLLATAASPADKQRVEELYHAGVRHHLADRLTSAISSYREALDINPGHPSVLNNLGGALIKAAEGRAAEPAERQRADAARMLQLAVDLVPDFHDAYLNLGYLRRSRGQLEEARAAYAAAVAVAPADGMATAHERLGSTLLRMSAAAGGVGPGLGSDESSKHAEAAATALGTAAALRPADAVLHERHGDALLALAAYLHGIDGGQRDVMRAAEAAASSAGAAATAAAGRTPPPPSLVTSEAAYERALESLSRAVELRPASSSANSKLAMAAHGLGTHGRPWVKPLLWSSMRRLQLDAEDATALVQLEGGADAAAADGLAGQKEAGAACVRVGEGGAVADAGACSDQEGSDAVPAAAAVGGARTNAGGMRLHWCERHYAGQKDLPGSDHAPDCRLRFLEASPSPDVAEGGDSLLAAFATPIYVHSLPSNATAALNPPLLAELSRRAKSAPSVSRSNRGGWQSSPELLSPSANESLAPPLHQLREHALHAVRAMLQRLQRASPVGVGGRPGAEPPRLRIGILNAWANVNRAGDVNLFHDHPQATLSGVYYARGVRSARATDGDGDDGRRCVGAGRNGTIEFIDPRYTLRAHRPPAQFEPRCQDLEDETGQLRPGYIFEYSPPLQLGAASGTFVLFPSWVMHRVRAHWLKGSRVSVSFNVWLADEDGGVEHTRRLFDGVFAAAMPASR